jgi:hypothetical protein
MGFEVFLQTFNASETKGIPLEKLIALFEGRLSKSKYGDYLVRYGRGVMFVDLFVEVSKTDPQLVTTMTVSRPLEDIRLWNSLFEILRVAPMCLYYPGDGPPLVAQPALVKRKSPIFTDLGRPMVVRSGEEIRNAIVNDGEE